MSPSWSKLLRARCAPRAAAGLTLGRQDIGLAELSSVDGVWRVNHLAELRLDVALFSGQPTPEIVSTLADAFRKLGAPLAHRYVPVHVSLPDALVQLAVFELDELPKTRAAQLELVRWRFAREIGDKTPSTCAFQSLGGENGKHLLLGFAVDALWLQSITTALTQAGIVAWSIRSNACRQFNRFHDRMVGDSSALVTVSSDAWALWLWDRHGRPRYTRARWRAESTSSPTDHAEIATEVERSILSYVYAAPDRAVARVYLVMGDRDAALTTALDARLREPCVALPFDDGISLEPSVPRAPRTDFLSLAAASER